MVDPEIRRFVNLMEAGMEIRKGRYSRDFVGILGKPTHQETSWDQDEGNKRRSIIIGVRRKFWSCRYGLYKRPYCLTVSSKFLIVSSNKSSWKSSRDGMGFLCHHRQYRRHPKSIWRL